MGVIKERLLLVEMVDLKPVFIAIAVKMSIPTPEQGAGIRYAALDTLMLQN
jgi:hypothetical protein